MSAPIVTGRFMTPVELDGRLTRAQKHAASLYIASKAHDADDARLLLQALGLIDSERDTNRVRTAYGEVRSRAAGRKR